MDPISCPVTVKVVVAGEQSEGAYGIVEVQLAAGARVAPHVAGRHALDLVVLEGAVEVVAGRRRATLAAGERIHVAAGEPRALVAPAAARLLCLATPAGLEHVATIAADPRVSADDLAAFLSVADVRVLPPSLWHG